MKNIVFTGGGSGGHIYPGIAIVDELRKLVNEVKVDGESAKLCFIWIGSTKKLDKEIVEKTGSIDRFIAIPSGKLRRYFSFRNFIDVFKIIAGFILAFFSLLKIKPVAVFSKGGFVSVPPCLAAKILHIPVYTHECDFSPGLATRINSKSATKILVSFEATKENFNSSLKDKVIVTGNPVRPVFYQTDKQKGLSYIKEQFAKKNISADFTKPILLVLGGSLGARQINEIIKQNVNWIYKDFLIVHQVGKAGGCELLKNDNYLSLEFIYQEIPDVIACSDVVLSRAGSNFLWECVALQKPLILIPLSGSGTRGDQVENAKWFEKNEAAKVLYSDTLNENSFKETILYMKQPENREMFINAIKKMQPLEKPAAKIAKIIFNDIGDKICL